MNEFKINDIVRFKRDDKLGVVRAITKKGHIMLDGSLYEGRWFPESKFKPTEYVSDNGDIKVDDLVVIKPPLDINESPGFYGYMHECQKLALRVISDSHGETVLLDDGYGWYWNRKWLHRVSLDIFQYVKNNQLL